MSESNLETIKAVYDAFTRGDVEAILAVVDDNVDWASDTSSDAAPWYGTRHGKNGVADFFTDFGTAMDVEEFTPVSYAVADDEVHTVVNFRARSRKTDKTVSMRLHHWFRFRAGKIVYYRGTEDTAITIAALTP